MYRHRLMRNLHTYNFTRTIPLRGSILLLFIALLFGMTTSQVSSSSSVAEHKIPVTYQPPTYTLSVEAIVRPDGSSSYTQNSLITVTPDYGVYEEDTQLQITSAVPSVSGQSCQVTWYWYVPDVSPDWHALDHHNRTIAVTMDHDKWFRAEWDCTADAPQRTLSVEAIVRPDGGSSYTQNSLITVTPDTGGVYDDGTQIQISSAIASVSDQSCQVTWYWYVPDVSPDWHALNHHKTNILVTMDHDKWFRAEWDCTADAPQRTLSVEAVVEPSGDAPYTDNSLIIVDPDTGGAYDDGAQIQITSAAPSASGQSCQVTWYWYVPDVSPDWHPLNHHRQTIMVTMDHDKWFRAEWECTPIRTVQRSLSVVATVHPTDRDSYIDNTLITINPDKNGVYQNGDKIEITSNAPSLPNQSCQVTWYWYVPDVATGWHALNHHKQTISVTMDHDKWFQAEWNCNITQQQYLLDVDLLVKPASDAEYHDRALIDIQPESRETYPEGSPILITSGVPLIDGEYCQLTWYWYVPDVSPDWHALANHNLTISVTMAHNKWFRAEWTCITLPDTSSRRIMAEALIALDDGSLYPDDSLISIAPESNGFYQPGTIISLSTTAPTEEEKSCQLTWLSLVPSASPDWFELTNHDPTISVTVEYDTWYRALWSCLDQDKVCHTLNRLHEGDGNDPVATPAHSGGCGTGTYVAGEWVDLEARQDSGWEISGWSGTEDDGSTESTNRLLMPVDNHTVTVRYIREREPMSIFMPTVHMANADTTPASFPQLADGNLDTPENSSWQETSSQSLELIIPEEDVAPMHIAAASPPNLAWLGGRENERSLLSQSIQLPADFGLVKLHFSYWIGSLDSTCEGDRAYINVNNQSIYDIDLCRPNNSSEWGSASVDISEFIGERITITFLAELDSDDQISNWFIDNISLCDDSPEHPCD
ncbi:MAG: hypothetical protein KDD92_20235 [Caldilineaceae bacterium]|nr:hypothetical protein [Caldilineaceae bacterium]